MSNGDTYSTVSHFFIQLKVPLNEHSRHLSQIVLSFYSSLVWVYLPADHPQGLVSCSLAYSVRSRMTVQQYFKLKPASVGLISLHHRLLHCLGFCWTWSFDSLPLNTNMFLYRNIFSPSLSTWFQLNPQITKISGISPCFFVYNHCFPPLYTWFWLLGFHFWTKFWFGLSFFFNMFKWVFTLCVCVNMYGVVNALTKASMLPDNMLINLAVTVLRAEPAVLSLCSFSWNS